MRSIKDFILLESREDEFNDWLANRFGVADLYEYFMQQAFEIKGLNKSNCDQKWKEYWEDLTQFNPDLIDNAEDVGLDPRELSIEAFHDFLGMH